MSSGDGAAARFPLVAAGRTVNGCSRVGQSRRIGAANVPSDVAFPSSFFFPLELSDPSTSPPPRGSSHDHESMHSRCLHAYSLLKTITGNGSIPANAFVKNYDDRVDYISRQRVYRVSPRSRPPLTVIFLIKNRVEKSIFSNYAS